MLDSKRFVIKIGGESGQGINTVGELISKSLKNSGLNIFAYREYPSLIRGGVASYQVDFSDAYINSSSNKCDILLCISRRSVHDYLRTLRENGILLHSIASLTLDSDELLFIENNNIRVEYLNVDQEVLLIGGRKIMATTILVGYVWKALGFDLLHVERLLEKRFASKPQILKMNIVALRHGSELNDSVSIPLNFLPAANQNFSEGYVISGNEALSLGAIAAGMRAFYAYPMTPSSSILQYLAETSEKSGVLVRHVEDEISAAQMSLGSMYMGTRAMTATSGGGFDLMTETLSLAGMIEVPWVCVLAQRPGPATGLPTWTSAADLNLAIYSGHGEFARCVIAVSDAKSAYTLIQEAFNIAEKFQIPTIILTEKQIAESLYFVDKFSQNVIVERGLLDVNGNEPHTTDRYKYSKDGVSSRWLPGQFPATYNSNSDEHTMDGSITEDSEPTIAMINKRMKKLESLLAVLPEPTVYGNPKAGNTIIGWGSTKSVILDCIRVLEEKGVEIRFNYVNYDYIFPLKTETLLQFKDNNLYVIEGNYTAQLARLITQETGIMFNKENMLLKYDGRPFFLEEIYNFVSKI